MKKILITGGAGFIGFHVARTLLKQGAEIVILDNFNDFYDPQLKVDRIAQLQPFKHLRVHQADIMDRKNLDRLFKKHHFGKICHLAAQANVRHSLQDPFRYDAWNTTGTLNILDAACEHGVRDLVIASSSSVYGADSHPVFHETHCTDQPLSMYAATKKATEMYAHVYHHLHGLNCTLLRFFTAYGPWGRPDMALSCFTKAILANRPITLFNHGKSQRDFTYIDDIVQGVCLALEKPFPFEIINLGSHKPATVLDTIRLLENKLAKKAKIRRLPLRKEDLPRTHAGIRKAHRLLGYRPRTGLDLGLDLFLEWYLDYYHAPSRTLKR